MKKMTDMWNKLKMWQQILIVLTVIGVAFSLFYTNTKPDAYNLLFSELEAKEAIEIGNELSNMGVDFKLEEENTTIMVKTTDVATVRMQLASKGLPSVSGPGFELFDGNKLGASSFENDVNYTRALTSTIQKNLVSGIDSIASAQVQIPLIEKKRFFEQDEEPLTAKVIIEEKPGQRLTASQVKGIQNFVAGAAKNLKTENVTVLNQQGEIISDNSKDGVSVSGSYAKQEEIKAQMEERIRQDITKTLSSVFGYDNVRLTIRTDINFDEIVQNIEKYDPKGTLVSTQSSKESTKETTEGDVEAGMESNGDVVDYELQEGQNGTLRTSEKEELIENFEVGKTIETIKKNPELQNILVSVYVDETQISVDKIADLEESVAFSAGLIDTDNNGKYDNGAISVKTYEFKKSVIEEEVLVEEPVQDFYSDNKLLIIILGVLGVIVIVLIVLLAFVSSKKKKDAAIQEETMERMKLQKQTPAYRDDEEEEEVDIDLGPKKEDKIKVKILDETVKHAKEDTNKTIEYVRKSLNER